MADKAAEHEAGAEVVLPKSKLPLILSIVLVLVVAGGAAGYFLLLRQPAQAAQAAAQKPTRPARARRGSRQKLGPTMPVDTFIVNLNEPGATRYLKLGLELEFIDPIKDIDKKLALRMRDRSIIYLSGLRVRDVQGPVAKRELKKQLLAICDKVFGRGAVSAVYIKMLVMQ